MHLPPVFDDHWAAIKEQLKDKPVSIIVDEAKDDRDRSVLNVIASYLDKLYLIDVIFMESCDHQSLAQAVIKAVTQAGIDYNNILSFVMDNAAYCKAAFDNILCNVFPKAIHVGCMAHILNLVSEDLVKDAYFRDIEVFVNDKKRHLKDSHGGKNASEHT